MSPSPPTADNVASLDNLYAAWERVWKNHGCAGIDGVSVDHFHENRHILLRRLCHRLESDTYTPLPLLRILVAKRDGSPRALSIPAVVDRVAQASALAALQPILEPEFEQCSFAYRPGRSVRQAVMQVRSHYQQGYQWVVDADIDAYFDSVPQQRCLEKLRRYVGDARLLHWLRMWIEADVWDGKTLTRLKQGLPQGSVVSPILANLYLDEFDESLLAAGLRVVRYGDDFLILCKSEEKALQAAQLTDEILDRLGLALDESDVKHFDDGFTFLGVFFCRSVLLTPFACERSPRKVLYMPPPFDWKSYIRHG